MNSHRKPVIGVHVEDGFVSRITSDDADVVGSTVVVVDDGCPIKALLADGDDGTLEEHARAAADSTRCHGIGIACDIAADRMRELARTKFHDPKLYIGEIADLVDSLADMMAAALKLQPVGGEV
jgi:hypothetical protein